MEQFAPLQIAQARVASIKSIIEALPWIPIDKVQPLAGQHVAFICKSHDETYNGIVMGGRYMGFRFDAHEFSTPGFGCDGSHWLPLPKSVVETAVEKERKMIESFNKANS